MKWLFVFLLVPLLVFGQRKVIDLDIVQPEFLTVNVDSTETVKAYYLYPTTAGPTGGDRFAPSETAPTSATRQAKVLRFQVPSEMYLSFVTDTVTAEESDSLSLYLIPYFYDKTKAAFYAASDTLFLDLDATASTYTGSAAVQTDYAHGIAYNVKLTSSQLWASAGFVLVYAHTANDNAGADANVYTGFWFVQ